eukprot:Blabericola_migrator_1__3924@NODE_2188_length_3151_cov_52_928988_g579_i1_p1_GENE_NODE_2188_length_3151_cov_52_928988_g579_i1NODE_2188_length_3151_cov_52_928988_g579_i1_p1_ORF_typecomplete_len789_score125_36Chromate_transp/PF02417_15/0_014_NODE_2188_length_3151_cov_52_928988_g579_i17063072
MGRGATPGQLERRRLSFDLGFEGALVDEVEKQATIRSEQDAHTLIQGTEAIADAVWSTLCEVLSSSGCEGSLQRHFRPLAAHEVSEGFAVTPACMDMAVRRDMSNRILQSLDSTLTRVAGDLATVSARTLTALGVLRDTAVLIDLYTKLWLEEAPSEQSEVQCIPHLRKWRLLQWATQADSSFDLASDYENAQAIIVTAERKMVTLAQINRSFVISGSKRMEVSKIISKLFLFGSWDAALSLLKRCYSHTDEALTEFEELLRKHFPTTHFDLGDVDSPRHPFRRPADLKRFRRDVQSVILTDIKITDDHLLRDILLITAAVDDEDEEEEVSIFSQGIGTFAQEEEDLPPHEAAMRRIFVTNGGPQVVPWFAAHLFWLSGPYERACLTTASELVDSNAIAYLFQRWWHDRGFQEMSLGVNAIACALILGNNMDWLHSHMVQYRACFAPLAAFTFWILTFFDFDMAIKQLPEGLHLCLLDYADIIAGIPPPLPVYKPVDEQHFMNGVRSVALFVSVYQDYNTKDEEAQGQRHQTLNVIGQRHMLSPLYWTSYKLYINLSTTEPTDASQIFLAQIQSVWNLPLDPELRLFLACLAGEAVAELWAIESCGSDDTASNVPLWAREALEAFDQRFRASEQTESCGSMKFIQCLRNNLNLTHRIEQLLEHDTFPHSMLEMTLVAHSDWLSEDEVKGSALNERVQCFALIWKLLEKFVTLHSTVSPARLWSAIDRMLKERSVPYSRAEARLKARNFEKCIAKAHLDEEAVVQRLRTLRSLVNSFTDGPVLDTDLVS